MKSTNYIEKQIFSKLFILIGAIFVSSCNEKESSNSSQPVDIHTKETIQVVEELDSKNPPKNIFSEKALQSSIQNLRARTFNYQDSAYSEDESFSHHQFIAEELLTRVEILASAPKHEQRALKSRLSDLVDALSLLQKADSIHGVNHQGRPFLDNSYSLRIKALEDIWQQQPNYAARVDSLLSHNGFLNCEHTPQLFKQWASSPDEDS